MAANSSCLGTHHILEACGVGDEEDDGVVISLRGEHVTVEPHEGLTLLDRIVRLHLCLEAVAIKLNRIDTDVDQKLRPRCGGDTDRMAGLEEHGHLSISRSYDGPLEGLDGNALADGAGGEHLIVHILESDDLAGNGSDEDLLLGLTRSRRRRFSLVLRCSTGQILARNAKQEREDKAHQAGNNERDNEAPELHVESLGEVDICRKGEQAHTALGEQGAIEEGHYSAADGRRGNRDYERTLKRKGNAINRGLGDTKEAGNGCGKCTLLELCVAGTEINGEDDRHSDERDALHIANDVLKTLGEQAIELNGDKRLMQAENDERLPKAANQHAGQDRVERSRRKCWCKGDTLAPV